MKHLSKLRPLLYVLILLGSGEIAAQQRGAIGKPAVSYTVASGWDMQLPPENIMTGYLGTRYFDNLKNRLLKVDEEALLDGYLHRPGKHRWIGEHVGKYLESAANTWMITKDPNLKKQMDRMAKTLMSTQLPNGYLGTYSPENYWTSWDVWSHKYNLIGLLAYYQVTGDVEALNVSKKIGNLLCQTFGDAPGQKDIIKAGTHVGMAATSVIDPMVDLYRWTGDKKYLDFCHYIIRSYDQPDGPGIIKTLLKEKRVDKVANAKAYEMLSNLVGVLKLYRVTGEQELLTASKNAFDDIVSKRLYISGTTSDHERFQDDFVLSSDTSAHMGEGCVTVTWMQFNMQLFSITGDLKYYNEIEKPVYNQLLAAENPVSGCVSYYTPLIGVKPYRCHITCCLSSVPRGIAYIPYLNYGQLNKRPALLLYESANIKDTVFGKNNTTIPLKLIVKSQFPQKGAATVEVKLSKEADFELLLRVPYWAKSYVAKINGKTYRRTNDGFIRINRKWNNDDKIDVAFDVPVTVIQGNGQSYPGFVAIKRGPQVLSLDASLTSLQAINKKIAETANVKLTDAKDKLPENWVGVQAYDLPINKTGGKGITLVPYADASQTGGYATVWIPVESK